MMEEDSHKLPKLDEPTEYEVCDVQVGDKFSYDHDGEWRLGATEFEVVEILDEMDYNGNRHATFTVRYDTGDVEEKSTGWLWERLNTNWTVA